MGIFLTLVNKEVLSNIKLCQMSVLYVFAVLFENIQLLQKTSKINGMKATHKKGQTW